MQLQCSHHPSTVLTRGVELRTEARAHRSQIVAILFRTIAGTRTDRVPIKGQVAGKRFRLRGDAGWSHRDQRRGAPSDRGLEKDEHRIQDNKQVNMMRCQALYTITLLYTMMHVLQTKSGPTEFRLGRFGSTDRWRRHVPTGVKFNIRQQKADNGY